MQNFEPSRHSINVRASRSILMFQENLNCITFYFFNGFTKTEVDQSSLFFFFFAFQGCTCGIWRFPGWGQIGAVAASHSHSHSHSNVGSDPSRVCDLYHSSKQRWILNPLSEARDRTCVLMDASQILSAEPWWEFQPFFFFLIPRLWLLLTVLDENYTLKYFNQEERFAGQEKKRKVINIGSTPVGTCLCFSTK